MLRFLAVLLSIFVGIISNYTKLQAQCAMCKATLANSVSSGQNIGAGVNAGIVYLATFPYLILAIIAYLWYRNSRRNMPQKKRVIVIEN